MENNNPELEEESKNNKNENENEKNKEDIGKDFEILPKDSSIFDYNYKLIIIGDSSVGKTSLTHRATSGVFKVKNLPTIGFEFFPFIVKYKDTIIKLEIWDTCGQETYRSLIKSYFSNSSLAIIVYAINNRKSFNSIEEWIRQCKSLCSPETKFFLIGNKNDVDDDQ
jgi:small GTP-binding protein